MANFEKIFNSPGFHIGFVSRALRNNIEKRFHAKGYDISFAQWPIMVALWHYDDLSQKHLSCIMHKNKTSITRMLATMEKHGIITRETDPKDKRNKLINLTEKGRDLVEELVPIIENFVDDMCKGLEPEEIKFLNSTIAKVFENITGFSMYDISPLKISKQLITNIHG